MKAAITLFICLAVGLGVALLMRHNRAVEEQKMASTQITTLKKEVEQTKTKLDDAEQLAVFLRTNLSQRTEELHYASNTLTRTMADLARTQKEAAAAAEAAKAEMAKRDSKISELSSQLDDQSKKMDDLNTSIEGLSKMIHETERKLAASEGDRSFLLKELKRLQTEKAELERQFNDLAQIKAQLSKLKEELSVARRLEWIRMGIYGGQTQKGAERLMSAAAKPTGPTNFNLNVELRQDSGATILPPNSAPK